MGNTKKDKPQPKAVLVMEVHYDQDMSLPSREELNELVEKAREYGNVVKADYKVIAPVTESLI